MGTDIHKRIEEGYTGKRYPEQVMPGFFHDGPLRFEFFPRKRQDDQGGCKPAKKIEADGRYLFVNRFGNNKITGPDKSCQYR